MKKILFLFAAIFLFPIFSLEASAEEIYAKAADEFGASILDEMLSEEEKEISGKFLYDGSYDTGGALARLWRNFVSRVVSELKENLEDFTGLIALALLSTLGCALCGNSKEICSYIEIIGCGSAAALLFGSMDSIVSQTVEAMYRLSDYSKVALPVVFTAAAASGAVSSSAVKFAAISFAIDVLISLSQKLIIPVIYAFLAISLTNCIFSNPLLSAVQRFCKWAATTMMSAATVAFTSYISMIGAIGSAVDTSAVKTAKSFISGALPVVGGMISDASALVLSAAGVVRSCAGVFGLISVCIMCAGPFAVLSVKMMLLKGVAAVSESMDNKKLSALFSGLGTSMALLLGLLGSCGIMLFISLTAGMKAVSI